MNTKNKKPVKQTFDNVINRNSTFNLIQEEIASIWKEQLNEQNKGRSFLLESPVYEAEEDDPTDDEITDLPFASTGDFQAMEPEEPTKAMRAPKKGLSDLNSDVFAPMGSGQEQAPNLSAADDIFGDDPEDNLGLDNPELGQSPQQSPQQGRGPVLDFTRQELDLMLDKSKLAGYNIHNGLLAQIMTELAQGFTSPFISKMTEQVFNQLAGKEISKVMMAKVIQRAMLGILEHLDKVAKAEAKEQIKNFSSWHPFSE